jgi:hypothetical protein
LAIYWVVDYRETARGRRTALTLPIARPPQVITRVIARSRVTGFPVQGFFAAGLKSRYRLTRGETHSPHGEHMRTKLLALSAVAVMSLATALPAAAAPESLTCSGSVSFFGRTIPFSTTATVDSSLLSGLSTGQVVKLSNGLTATITSASITNGTLSFTANAALRSGITATVACSGPAPTV